VITHLVVPGLLGHLPRLQEYESEIGALPRFPNLELLLSRAKQLPAPDGYAQTLFELFGATVQDDADVPTAAVCYAAEAGTEPLQDIYLMHADPVHLRADQDRLLAFDFYHQPITIDEARQFAEAFNRHFSEDGLRLLTPHATRWYLAVEKQPMLRTRALGEVLGRNVDFFLPEGEDAGVWRSWMNELQMLFHGLPVNQTRESFGQLPVSGLWFSGGGSLPADSMQGYSLCEGECILVDGLQRLSRVKRDLRLVVQQAPGRALVDANPVLWVEAIQALDAELEAYLRGELLLYPCEGSAWHWKPTMRRHFWKQRKALSNWLKP